MSTLIFNIFFEKFADHSKFRLWEYIFALFLSSWIRTRILYADTYPLSGGKKIMRIRTQNTAFQSEHQELGPSHFCFLGQARARASNWFSGSVRFLYRSRSSDLYPDFTDSDPDPSRLSTIVNVHIFWIHHISEKKKFSIETNQILWRLLDISLKKVIGLYNINVII